MSIPYPPSDVSASLHTQSDYQHSSSSFSCSPFLLLPSNIPPLSLPPLPPPDTHDSLLSPQIMKNNISYFCRKSCTRRRKAMSCPTIVSSARNTQMVSDLSRSSVRKAITWGITCEFIILHFYIT